MRLSTCVLVIFLIFAQNQAKAQGIKHEMRGAWVTTVYGLDWPTQPAQSSASQIAELKSIFNDLQQAGINAVFFQIRSEADAMYESQNEPWSRFLTGTMGAPPEPYYDPLALAIELAHDRGMELHAWMNPFRAVSSRGSFGLSSTHIANTRPDWILNATYKGSNEDLEDTVVPILNPGILETHDYIADVVRDVVVRYNVDGIHFDDYFYPYPSYNVTVEDQSYYDANPRGQLTLPDWRRDNISRFVATVSSTIRSVDPTVKFGISPFAIWKSGVPQGIVGLSSYDVIFADATKWLDDETVDYLVPQLYWPFGGGQDFGTLADWWVSKSNGRHIYTGIAAYRVDAATTTGTRYSAAEIPLQIDFGRNTAGIEGSVFFRAQNLRPLASNLGLSAALKDGYYAQKAFTPYMTYTDLSPPDSPSSLTATQNSNNVSLRWDPAITGFAYANKFGVYRVRSDGGIPNSLEMTNNAANLIAISWEPEYTDFTSLEAGGTYYYAVTGVSPNSVEGPESMLTSVVAVDTATERLPSSPVLAVSVYPNPANSPVTIDVDLGRSTVLSMQIYDVLGRRVHELGGGPRLQTPGRVTVKWDLAAPGVGHVPSGMYFVIIKTDAGQKTIPVHVVQ